ncbi:MAG: hypothetical protein OHK0013_19190 [Sandaracinaceae bacterium]
MLLLASVFSLMGCTEPMAPLPSEGAPLEGGGERGEPTRADAFVSSQVAAALGQMGRAATTRGFTRDGVEHRGFLVERGPDVREASLRSGSCYLFVAAASEAVRELEITLYHGDGTEVGRDDATGRLAAFHHCPAQSGVFYLGVQATAGNGLFGLRTFRGPNGLDVRTADIVRAAEPERSPR